MSSHLPFTFGIPLLPRACARDWRRIETLLELTLTSVFQQTEPDFRVIVAGHDRPASLPDDPRIAFLQAGWPAEAVRADNGDRGRKAHAVNARVQESGGGLLMFLDADDWVDMRLVESARSAIQPHHVGGVIDAGFAVDVKTLRAVPVPHPDVFGREFHRICGSSVVLQVSPGHPHPLRRDPYPVLHQHHRVADGAAARGAQLARLDVSAAYVINTQENHSEIHGPYAEWRRTFRDAVNRVGTPVGADLAGRFGLRLDRLRDVALGLSQPCPSETRAARLVP